MKISLTLLCLLFTQIIYADVPPQQATEVRHLLAFVKSSNCKINRNGQSHNAQKAAEHIEKKYNYYKDDIQTTEDFIQHSATKSTLSGKNYTVTCPSKNRIKTQQWLLDELSRFRKTNHPL